MPRNANESRFAAAFATLVCAWALGLVVLSLSTAPRTGAAFETTAVVAAAAGR